MRRPLWMGKWFYWYWDPVHTDYPLVSIRLWGLLFKVKKTERLLFSERYRYCKFRHDFKNGWSLILDWRRI